MKYISLAAVVTSITLGCSGHRDKIEFNEVSYACDRDKSVNVRFYPGLEKAILVYNDNETELQQEPAGSGFKYSNGPISIRGKANDLTVYFGRLAPLQCMSK